MSGDQIQRPDLRSHDGEVTVIDRGDVVHAETFCNSDDGCVNRAEREVAVLHDQLGDPHPVGRRNWLGDEVAGSEIAEEVDLGIDAQSGAEQVEHFGNDESRHDQRPGVRLEQFEACPMMSVIAVDVGVERAGVDDQRDESTSLARSSSMRSEMSARPLAPAPAPRSRRLPCGASSNVSIASRVSCDRMSEMTLIEGLPQDRRARVEIRLHTNLMAWLTTVTAAGRPDSVPVWYLFRDDDSILVYSQPGKAKLRNIDANPNVSLGLDVTDIGRDIIRIEGTAAHVAAHPAADQVAEYVAKYTERIGAIFGTVEQFARTFTEAIVITPSRLHA
jgi:PPOX class probable F420-dependent enzyme